MMIKNPPPSKENDGKSAKKRTQRRIMKWIILCLLLNITTTTIYIKHFAGMFVPDKEINPATGKEVIRRRPERHYQRLNPDVKTTPRDAALEGFLTLIDVNVKGNGLQGGTGGKKYEAIGTFCHINWKLQQKNPSIVPMFKDLQSQSDMCTGTVIQEDLYDFTRDAHAYDTTVRNSTTEQGTLPVPPTGVVFHETRCGSTLTANLLASFRPNNSKVYSESPPPVKALRACENSPCDPTKHKQLIQDVFYLMGRTLRTERPQHVFYKIQSIGTMAIDKFTTAFPDVPWVFMYRDSVEIMMSHLKDVKRIAAAATKNRLPVCARNFRYPMIQQPKTTQQILQKHGKTMEDLQVTEYCAAHLAALSLAAIQEHERSGKGKFVNYNQLPDIGWTKILPEFFGVSPIDDTMVDSMKKVAGVYSKGRGKTANQEWKDDSERKKETAPEEVVAAAKLFLGDVFEKMELLSKE